MSDLDRFWSRVQPAEWDECWIWLGGGGAPPNDYGRFRAGDPKRTFLAHRFSYETMVGPIPDGLTLDHLCRVKRCVNPEHLDPTTIQVNIGRGRFAQQTHCLNGHSLDEANTRRTPKGRVCKRCAADRESARRTKVRAAVLAGETVPLRHGSAFAYRSGCHCDDCRAGNTRRFREYRARKRDD